VLAAFETCAPDHTAVRELQRILDSHARGTPGLDAAKPIWIW
jgi:hypothetical protein